MTDPNELPSPQPCLSEGEPRVSVVPRPRGAPRGNRNALKHGFYARTFPSSEVKDLETYPFQGLQDAIAAPAPR